MRSSIKQSIVITRIIQLSAHIMLYRMMLIINSDGVVYNSDTVLVMLQEQGGS